MSLRLSTWRSAWPALLATALALPTTLQADTGHARAPQAKRAAAIAAMADDANSARVIVKYRQGAALLQASPERARHASALGRRLALPLEDGRALGPRMQALRGKGLNSAALAARLAAQPDVEWAVVDRRRSIAQVPPNDPYFADAQTSVTPVVGQWYLRAPSGSATSATNAVGAWAITTGSPSMVVAVLDTGVRFDHPDLAGKLLPGYDFVRTSIAGDGDGRDADASDPGDWASPGDSCYAAGGGSTNDSSWHGTQVAGLIGAATHNAQGMAGLAYNVKVLPVRVLGRCGGYDSEIIAGMLWAGGVSSDPYVNPNPARVINMSLGSEGSCSVAYQDAVNQLAAAKVAVVAAAGNDTGHAVNTPANCPGVIAVAGLRHAGTKVGYSNIGPQVTIGAPAGNCINVDGGPCLYPLLTTVNLGTTSPGANSYSDSFNPSLGTSFATPLVAGAAALMLSVDSSLTPAQLKSHLQATARPFPTTGGTDATVLACAAPTATDQLECYCTTSTCGAGMLDVGAAVQRVASQAVPTAVIATSTATPTAGQTVSLDGRGSAAAAGRVISSWQWSITSGAALASFSGATNAATATLATTGAGTVAVTLTVTDSLGLRHSASTTVNVQPVGGTTGPGAGSSGGGAMGWGWLVGLALAVLAIGRPTGRRRL